MTQGDFEWATDPEAVAAAMARRDLDKPVGMLNLLKFREHAHYAPDSGEEPCSGEQAYARYAQLVAPLLHAMGARIILSGYSWMIGSEDEWDRAFVVRYERASDLIGLPGKPEYLRIAHHREAALADTRLLMMDFDDSAFF